MVMKHYPEEFKADAVLRCGPVCYFSGDVGVAVEEGRAGFAVFSFVQGRPAPGDELPGLGAGPGLGQGVRQGR
ncbi:hypothetical protein GCM10010439_64990 [Actinocorallia aurantiaca]|uniref:Uncharacterized protein n=1 Tax=Actinocorallia aurantiaca TaxID=46204 RepID=A0ABN3UPK9_9ACTN